MKTLSSQSAFIALNLAMELGQATPEVIWWGAIGVTHCFHMRRIERFDYSKLVSSIEGEVSRVANKNYKTRFDFKISHVNEYVFLSAGSCLVEKDTLDVMLYY